MTPFGYTVCLIDGQKPHTSSDMSHGSHEAFIVEPLRCAVEYVERSGPHGLDRGHVLIPRLRGVQYCCANTFTFEGVDLVFHQCNEWRYHKRDTALGLTLTYACLPVHLFESERRHLVA